MEPMHAGANGGAGSLVTARAFSFPDVPVWLSEREAQRWFVERGVTVSLRTINRWRVIGALPCTRFGRLVRFRETDLVRALHEGVAIRAASEAAS